MIRPPKELIPYIEFEDGKIVAVNLPKGLNKEFEDFKKSVENFEKENPYSDL